jgi:hypothetical protein
VSRWHVAGLALLMGLAPAIAVRAQVPRLPRPQIQQPRRDSTHKDTTVADSALTAKLRLTPPDSITQALLKRPGYTVTRYEGDRVTFDAENDRLQILSPDSKRALVQRGDSQTVFADTGIYYNQRTKVATAIGNFIMHDPSSGQADVFGRGRLEYSLNERSASITNPSFQANEGAIWEIRALKGKAILGDSAAGKTSAFYGLGGELTSCTDSIPDYHFKFNEVKRSGSNTLVARPAVLYIRDIPVMWLPFLFSDMRPGRHSGILTPRFGVSDIIRTNPSYRRNVENIGYFWSINDYMDASAWLDWRSSAGMTEGDPGWTRFNGEWRYNWLDRFIGGSLASSYTTQRNGQTNLAITWGHRQSFTKDRRFSADVNYVTSTQLQRQNTFNPYQALATIRSALNYSDKIGPATLQVGGTRSQYPGRSQVDQTVPTVSINTGTLNVASWLQWTPNFSYTASQSLHIDQTGQFQYQYKTGPNGIVDSSLTKRDQYTAATSFDTPIRIFGYDLGNSFRVNERVLDYPQLIVRTDEVTGDPLGTQIFPNWYETDVDWTPNFTLPPLFRSLFNVTPGVSLANVTSGPFWVRTNLSDGKYVHQSKRPSFSLAASPVIYGLWPGFGPFTRLRHTLQPTISYGYAPRADVGADYLGALGRSAAHEFSGLQQNALSFGLNQNLEAKVRSHSDTNPEAGEKIKLLSLNLSSFTYDVDRAHAAHKAIRGLTTSNFTYSLSSDLLPGFQFSSGYSLFSGDPVSDTAKFSPYMESISASFNLAQGNNPFTVLTKLFGRAVSNDQRPSSAPTPDQSQGPTTNQQYMQQLANQPVAGSGARGTAYVLPPSQGWSAALTFSTQHTRPISGNVVQIDPQAHCQQLAQAAQDPFVLSTCLAQLQNQTTSTTQAPFEAGVAGATIYRNPPVTNLGGDFRFSLTEKWAVSWNTQYDFVRHQIAQQIVTLQRDLHDWRAVFAFTQSTNGNFAFNFFIALKAEPDLKFDYNKATVRSGSF